MEEKNLSSLVFGNVVLESQFLGTTPRIYAADMRSYSLRPSPYATLSAPLNDLRRQLQPDHAEAIAKKIFDSVAEELNEKMPAWIDCHVKALEFFGKLPAIIVFDNAATATYRPKKHATYRMVTDRYAAFTDYYGNTGTNKPHPTNPTRRMA